MKKTGYDQFFKQAQKKAQTEKPSSQVSIEALRKNISQNKAHRQNIRQSKKFPLAQFIVFIICAGGLFYVIENFDHLEQVFQKIEIGLGEAQAETSANKTQKAEDKKTDLKEKGEASTEASGTEPTSGSMKAASSEIEDADYLYKLNERKKQLDAKEEELAKKAQEIEAQKLQVEAKLKELEEYRGKISSVLQERIKTDEAKLDTLVQVYTNMKPNQAAKIFETMDEDLVIEILSKMKKKTAADILNLIKTEKAQAFAEKYAGYRVPASLPKTESNKDSSSGDNKEAPKP